MRTCTVEGCDNRHYAKGLCTKHYQRVSATGSTELCDKPVVCAIDGCSSKPRGQGLCIKHYSRMRRTGDPLSTGRIIGDDKARLRSSVIVTDAGCWEWQKFKKEGYGVTSLDGRLEQAHRASWIVYVGPIPSGVQINHRCHNRACINPEHLYPGTQKQNMDDMYAAGREKPVRGSLNGNAVLTEADVAEIKVLIAEGKKNGFITERFSVAITTIKAIRADKTWRHVVSKAAA